jgi:hypothetical protein
MAGPGEIDIRSTDDDGHEICGSYCWAPAR